METFGELLIKTRNVIESCEDESQLRVAENYVRIVLKYFESRSRSTTYIETEFAEIVENKRKQFIDKHRELFDNMLRDMFRDRLRI